MAKAIFKGNSSVWIEKYRPQSLDTYLGNSDVKEQFKEFIKNQEIPNLLLSGTPGIGKTTFANIIIQQLDCDVLYINASNENNVETVRTKITDFCITSSFTRWKIVILDESDGLTPQAQAMLRPITELYSKNVRFIFTCNYLEKIIPALQSRCQHFALSAPSKVQIKEHIKNILGFEKVSYTEEEMDSIINSCYPDIRKTVGTFEKQSVNGELKLDKDFFRMLQYQKTVIDTIKGSNPKNQFDRINEIRQLLADSRVKTYNELIRYLYDNIDEYKREDSNVVPIILTLAECQEKDYIVVDKEINIVSCLIKLIELLNK